MGGRWSGLSRTPWRVHTGVSQGMGWVPSRFTGKARGQEAKWAGEVGPSGVPSWDRVGEAPGRRGARQRFFSPSTQHLESVSWEGACHPDLGLLLGYFPS